MSALLLAVSLVLGRVFIIPIPWTHGNINLCDAGILIAAMLLGPASGAIVGGCGGLLLDLISGYAQYAIFSLIAHGLEGLVTAMLYQRGQSKLQRWLAPTVGVILMVICYFFADSFMYHSWMIGLIGIGANLLQGLVGVVIAATLTPSLQKQLPSIS